MLLGDVLVSDLPDLYEPGLEPDALLGDHMADPLSVVIVVLLDVRPGGDGVLDLQHLQGRGAVIGDGGVHLHGGLLAEATVNLREDEMHGITDVDLEEQGGLVLPPVLGGHLAGGDGDLYVVYSLAALEDEWQGGTGSSQLAGQAGEVEAAGREVLVGGRRLWK